MSMNLKETQKAKFRDEKSRLTAPSGELSPQKIQPDLDRDLTNPGAVARHLEAPCKSVMNEQQAPKLLESASRLRTGNAVRASFAPLGANWTL
jgi:hypothetical protein